MKMGRIILMLFLMNVVSWCMVQDNTAIAQPNGLNNNDEGIQFFVGTWEQALEMADLRKKPIFVHLYNSYTPACRKIENGAYKDYRAINFYHNKFINFKINLNSAEGMRFKKNNTLPMTSDFPALFYFDQEGTLLLQAAGEKNIEDFLALGQGAVNDASANSHNSNLRQASYNPSPSNGISQVFKNYIIYKVKYEREELRSTEFLYDYAYQLKKFHDPYEDVVIEYLSSISDGAFFDKRNAQFIHDFAENINSETFQLLIKHKVQFSTLLNREQVNKRIKEAIRSSVVASAANRDPALFNKALDMTKTTKVPNANEFQFLMKLLYDQNTLNWRAYLKTARRYLQKYTLKDSPTLDKIAWKFALYTSDKNQLNDALKWADQNIDSKPHNFKYYETKAALLHKMGKKSKAEKNIEVAINIAKEQGKDYKSALKIATIIRKEGTITSKIRK